MKQVEDIQDLVSNLGDELASYLTKPNKSKSKRIRVMLGRIKNQATSYRKILRDLDDKGYSK